MLFVHLFSYMSGGQGFGFLPPLPPIFKCWLALHNRNISPLYFPISLPSYQREIALFLYNIKQLLFPSSFHYFPISRMFRVVSLQHKTCVYSISLINLPSTRQFNNPLRDDLTPQIILLNHMNYSCFEFQFFVYSFFLLQSLN